MQFWGYTSWARTFASTTLEVRNTGRLVAIFCAAMDSLIGQDGGYMAKCLVCYILKHWGRGFDTILIYLQVEPGKVTDVLGTKNRLSGMGEFYHDPEVKMGLNPSKAERVDAWSFCLLFTCLSWQWMKYIINTYTAKPGCWNGWISDSYCSLKPLMLGHGGSSPGSYLADPTSPIPSHCAVIILFQSVAVHQLPCLAL